VDLGCGTGISTLPWVDYAENIIGIDPSQKMLEIAQKRSANPKIKYLNGFGSDIPLASSTVNAIVCSSSIHWMEPVSTFREIHRVLCPQGIFAAFGPKVPILPLASWQTANSFNQMHALAKNLCSEQKQLHEPKAWKWDEIESEMKQCGYFQYTDELCFNHSVYWNANSFCEWVESFSYISHLLKTNGYFINQFNKFRLDVQENMGDEKIECLASFRMLMAIHKYEMVHFNTR